MKKLKLGLLTLLFPLTVNAMAVDTMLKVGDTSGNGTFTLFNNKNYTEFITAKITKYDVKGSEIIKTKYTKDNLKDWEITLSNPKIILEQGRQKVVGVRSLCMSKCNFDKDRVYMINFVPTPYVDNEKKDTPKVGFTIGFSPLYIIPAKDSMIDYVIENRGSKLYVNNKGNTFFRLGLDQCTKNQIANRETLKCRTSYTVLAGREREFDIPDTIASDELNALILNHDGSYIKRHSLGMNDPVTP